VRPRKGKGEHCILSTRRVSEIGIVLSASGHLACVFNNLLGLILTREYLQLDGFVPAFFAFCGMAIPWSTPLAAGHLESLMGRSHFRKALVFLDIPVLFVLCPFVLEPWSSPASGFWLLGSSLLSPFIVHHSALRRFPPAGLLLQASGGCFPSLSFILPAFTTGCVSPPRGTGGPQIPHIVGMGTKIVDFPLESVIS